jgi:acetyl esterase/lipase
VKTYIGALCTFFIGAALVCTSQAKVPTIVTDKEAMTMRAEAETFLSSMPQGLQDSQADAIIEAMAGYPEELRNVRQSRNTVHESSPDVEFVQIEGEGNARGIAMSLFKPEKPQPKPLPLFIGDLDPTEPLISPAHANDTALTQLPPMLIINAQRDILCDQGKEFAQKYPNVTRVEFPGAVHLFITVKGQSTAFGKAVKLTADFLTSNF